MSEHISFDQIDGLVLTQLGRPGAWLLSFRSGHSGFYHQLYINGRLMDFSDSPAQRVFEVFSTDYPQELAVVAVSGRYRSVDLSEELPSDVRAPAWVLRTDFLRDIQHVPGDRIAVYHNGGSGSVCSEAAVVREIWPVSLSHWGFGQTRFGAGGFGLDGSSGPGLGGGFFGLGAFGIETELLETNLALSNEGEHAIEYRVISSDDEVSTSEIVQFQAWPPPPPVAEIIVTGYDSQSQQISLQLC